jgi:hypothetical protein
MTERVRAVLREMFQNRDGITSLSTQPTIGGAR